MLDLNSHRFDADGKITGKSSFIRLCYQDEPPIYLQDGKFYYEDGTLVKEAPSWLRSQLEICTDVSLSSNGLSEKFISTLRGKKVGDDTTDGEVDSEGSVPERVGESG